jgi:transketolase
MASISNDDLKLAANTIRGLSMDGVQKANSGHPGMPMGMADVAAVLFLRYLRHCPSDPDWVDRDRFVLSAGHGSMLIYSLLHLSGYDLPMSQLQSFRQWGSKTPGHPEYGDTAGVETTTGPLGQGCGNAVGMAIAEQMLAERLNSDAATVIDHYTYAICGDGDLMEGVSHEAFSIAGHLGLNKLIVFYDSNRITIEGSTDLTYSEDVEKRFQSYNWNVLEIDAHDYGQIEEALEKARAEQDRPTIIISHSHIAQGSPHKIDSAKAHGEPLGDEEILLTKQNLGLPTDQTFYVPDRVRELFAARFDELVTKAGVWKLRVGDYLEEPANEQKWRMFINGELPADLYDVLPEFEAGTSIATRAASGKVLQALAAAVPSLVGGSADLAPSTKTIIDGSQAVASGEFSGRNFHWGVREHGMCAILNGMALHGGLRPYGATFFVFSDYCRPSIRLAALMKIPVIYVFTHDSFFVGEDGPTHQPVEHLAALRAIPNLTVVRPADATETGAAWVSALKRTDGPTAMLFTRQGLPIIDRSQYPAASEAEKGAYTLWQSSGGDPEVILLASGSEVALAMGAAQELSSSHSVRVVSMPSWELFEEQPQEYRDEVLPSSCKKRLAVEAGVSLGWHRYVGDEGQVLGVDHFGASAPYKVLAEKFGFTVGNVVAIVKQML